MKDHDDIDQSTNVWRQYFTMSSRSPLG